MKKIDEKDEKTINFVEETVEFRVIVAMPGDVVICRPLDHHSVITVYMADKPGFSENDNYAMAIGAVIIRKQDLGDATR